MSVSKHFFEGYSRSKDTLHTIAQEMTEATLALPWSIKSEGRIVSTDSKFNDKYHVCLSKTQKNGSKINVLFLDDWNTETNDTWGSIKVYFFQNDGCDVANNIYINGINSNNSWLKLDFHSSTVPDIDATPQFAWRWIWVDEESVIITLFGNQGAAGTANPTYNAIYFGTGKTFNNNFKDTFIAYDFYNNAACPWDSLMADYINPELAPYTWEGNFLPCVCTSIVANNAGELSNPDIYKNNKFIAARPQMAQASAYYNSWRYEYIKTHILGSGQVLFCQPGSTLLRGDIVTIDSEGCDYVYQSLNGNEFFRNILIKRMESVSGLSLTNVSNEVELNWTNPEKCYGVKIVRKVDSAPTSHLDGETVFEENIDGLLIANASQVYVDTTALPSVHYFYRAFAYSSNNIYSVPVSSALADITLQV